MAIDQTTDNRITTLENTAGIPNKDTVVISKAFDTNQNLQVLDAPNQLFTLIVNETLSINHKILLYKQSVLGFDGIYLVKSETSPLTYIVERQIKSTSLTNTIINLDNVLYKVVKDKNESGITEFFLSKFLDYADILKALDLKENTITAGTTSQYYRGDKTFQTLNKAAVGLSNVDNTSDLLKPVSTATQNAISLKEDKENKNSAGGYVGLDSNSLISIPQITPSRFLAAGTNITLNEDPATKIVTISSTTGGGGGGGGSSNLPSDTLFSFRERIGSINWTINGGSNTFFNFTDEFFTQAIVDEDFNFLTGTNPYFIYDSVGQKLLMRSNLTNQRIKFKITLRVSYNGGAGSEFAFVLARPSLTTNNSVTNTIGVQKATQGQNIQSTQVIKHELTLFTTLLPTTGGTDPFQTEGFKLGFFNYSTNTAITITDAQLVIEQIN